MEMIKRLSLEQVKPGVRLARDVLDSEGQRLLVKGTRLEADKLELLRRRGVQRVAVVVGEDLTADGIAVLRQKITQRVDRRFRAVEDDTQMQHLKSVLLEYRLGTLE